MSIEHAHSQATDMRLSRRRFIAKTSALSGAPFVGLSRFACCAALATDFRFINELKKELRA